MRKRLSSAAAIAFLCSALAIAANVHFVKGPTFIDSGSTVTVTGKLAGLGAGDVTIIVDATGTATTECTNPGGNVAPGQTKTITTSGSQTVQAAKNGTVTFAVTTNPPTAPAGSCPNAQWTAEVVDVTFTSANITVIQNGQIVLTHSL